MTLSFNNLADDLLNYLVKNFLVPKEICCLKSVCKRTNLKIDWLKYLKHLIKEPHISKENEVSRKPNIYYSNISDLVIPYDLGIHLVNKELLEYLLKDIYYEGFYMGRLALGYQFQWPNPDPNMEQRYVVSRLIYTWINFSVKNNYLLGLDLLIQYCRKEYCYPEPKDVIRTAIIKYKNIQWYNKIKNNRDFFTTYISNWNILKYKGKHKKVIDKDFRDLLLVEMKAKIYTYKPDNHVKTWKIIARDKDYETAKIFFGLGILPPKMKDGSFKDRFIKDPELAKILIKNP